MDDEVIAAPAAKRSPPAFETPRMREAYREYLRLGNNRTYANLRELLLQRWLSHVPSVRTLETWGSWFDWAARVREDDEFIHRRTLETVRHRLVAEQAERRSKRLQLADIQLHAATKAFLAELPVIDPQTGEEVIDPATGQPMKQIQPADLRAMDASWLRAVNDTIRTAGETQRLDGGEATSRIAGEDGEVQEMRRGSLDDETRADLLRFVAVAEHGQAIEGEVSRPDEDGVRGEPDLYNPAADELAQ